MKNLIIFTFSILVISFLVSCDKDDPILPTIVNGQVLEQGSNKSLEGVKVVLMEGTYNGIGSGTYSFYPIDTFLTDKNGKYSYEHKTPFDKKAYELWYFKDKYFDISSVSENDRITRVEFNKTVQNVTKMFAFAWLSIRIINDKPFSVGDRIHIIGPWDAASDDNWYYGANINDVLTKTIKGGKLIRLSWDIYKNDKAVYSSDSIYIKPSDTTYYQIKY
jgi:hypothetical protein